VGKSEAKGGEEKGPQGGGERLGGAGLKVAKIQKEKWLAVDSLFLKNSQQGGLVNRKWEKEGEVEKNREKRKGNPSGGQGKGLCGDWGWGGINER